MKMFLRFFLFFQIANLSASKAFNQHKKNNRVVAQNMLVDMAIMMGSQFAVETANEWVVGQYEYLYDAIIQSSKNAQLSFTTFQNQVSSFVSAELGNTINSFSSAEANISKLTDQANADSTLEINYLMNMVNLNLPQQSYLFDQPLYDSFFAASKMYTPEGQSWYNIFKKGDWCFDYATSSFWQFNLIDAYQLDSSNTKTLDQAPFNYIFTEFFTKKDSYEIDCDITLYSVSYPFFAGIVFNNNRWISGDMSGLSKYRTVGIYGKSETDIGVYYAEQYTDSTIVIKDITQDTQIKHAMDQIFNGTAEKIASIDASEFKNISSGGVSYSFKITTSAQTVSTIFTPSGSTSSTTSSLSSKNAALFLYHGIGFISPGVGAQYKLNAPSSILFSADAIKNFKTEVDSLLPANA